MEQLVTNSGRWQWNSFIIFSYTRFVSRCQRWVIFLFRHIFYSILMICDTELNKKKLPKAETSQSEIGVFVVRFSSQSEPVLSSFVEPLQSKIYVHLCSQPLYSIWSVFNLQCIYYFDSRIISKEEKVRWHTTVRLLGANGFRFYWIPHFNFGLFVYT